MKEIRIFDIPEDDDMPESVAAMVGFKNDGSVVDWKQIKKDKEMKELISIKKIADEVVEVSCGIHGIEDSMALSFSLISLMERSQEVAAAVTFASLRWLEDHCGDDEEREKEKERLSEKFPDFIKRMSS